LLSDLYKSSDPRGERECLLELRDKLQQMRSVLKPHAAKGVIDSIDYWREWIEGYVPEPTKPPRPKKKNKRTSDAPAGTKPTDVETLAHQVRRWRGVLTGEKDASDLLTMGECIDAGNGLVEAYMNLGREYARRWWPYLVVVLAVVAAITVPIVIWGRNSASGVVAALVTALAGLGITGRSVSATLSKAADGVKDTLIEAETDTAIGIAATILPDDHIPDASTLDDFRAAYPAHSARSERGAT
jgi:hypothetical protein